MSAPLGYVVGRIYSLDEIRPVASRLKMVIFKKTALGTVYVYREKDASIFWLGGPLRGRDTNFFLYLGKQESKGQFMNAMKEELGRLADDMKNRASDYDFADAGTSSGDLFDDLVDWDFDFDWGD